MDAKLTKLLIADIKVWLAQALEKNDFGSVVRFSSYLEALIGPPEAAPEKAPKKVKAAKPAKAKKKRRDRYRSAWPETEAAPSGGKFRRRFLQGEQLPGQGFGGWGL